MSPCHDISYKLNQKKWTFGKTYFSKSIEFRAKLFSPFPSCWDQSLCLGQIDICLHSWGWEGVVGLREGVSKNNWCERSVKCPGCVTPPSLLIEEVCYHTRDQGKYNTQLASHCQPSLICPSQWQSTLYLHLYLNFLPTSDFQKFLLFLSLSSVCSQWSEIIYLSDS